jgi:hypothetical protein
MYCLIFALEYKDSEPARDDDVMGNSRDEDQDPERPVYPEADIHR